MGCVFFWVDQNKCESIIEKSKCTIFFINVHCMNHHTDLTIQIHSKLGIVGKIEDVLQNLYAYFFYGPKIIQEFIELTNIVVTRGQ
jgi:hypothetical protein